MTFSARVAPFRICRETGDLPTSGLVIVSFVNCFLESPRLTGSKIHKSLTPTPPTRARPREPI